MKPASANTSVLYRNMRRLLIAATMTAALPGSAGVAQPSGSPLVPLFTQFSYWDHHWLRWLPAHPVFEAIEAQVFTPDAG
jgi:hypothetical protein